MSKERLLAEPVVLEPSLYATTHGLKPHRSASGEDPILGVSAVFPQNDKLIDFIYEPTTGKTGMVVRDMDKSVILVAHKYEDCLAGNFLKVKYDYRYAWDWLESYMFTTCVNFLCEYPDAGDNIFEVPPIKNVLSYTDDLLAYKEAHNGQPMPEGDERTLIYLKYADLKDAEGKPIKTIEDLKKLPKSKENTESIAGIKIRRGEDALRAFEDAMGDR